MRPSWHGTFCYFRLSNELENKNKSKGGEKMNKKITAVSILFLILLFSVQISAKSWFKGEKEQSKKANILKELNLTKDQLKLMEEYRVAGRKKMIKVDAQLREKRLDLRIELRKENTNKTKVNEIIDSIGKFEAEKIKSKTETILNIKSILTQEQREKLIATDLFGLEKGRSFDKKRKKKCKEDDCCR